MQQRKKKCNLGRKKYDGQSTKWKQPNPLLNMNDVKYKG